MLSPLKKVITLYPPLFPLPLAANLTFRAPPVPGMGSPMVGFLDQRPDLIQLRFRHLSLCRTSDKDGSFDNGVHVH